MLCPPPLPLTPRTRGRSGATSLRSFPRRSRASTTCWCAELQRPGGRDRHHAAGRVAAAGRSPMSTPTRAATAGTSPPPFAARSSSPDAIVKLVRPGIAEYEPLDWKVVDSTHDHRHLRLHRRAARLVRPQGHQSDRRRGGDPVPIPGRAGDRARGHHRHRRPADDPGRRPGHLFGGPAEPRQPGRPLYLLRGGRPAAQPQPGRLRLAVSWSSATNVRGTPEGAAGTANEQVPWIQLESITNTDRAADRLRLPVRRRGGRLRRVQLQRHHLSRPARPA